MSSLTDEQRKRIEENRARALAKLAEKKSLAHPQQTSITAASNAASSKHSTSGSNFFCNRKPQVCNIERSQAEGLNLSRFEYHRGTPRAQQSTSSNGRNEPKNAVNNVLMKAKVVHGTCVLISKTRFKVLVSFHAKLIGVMKSLPSKSYDAHTHTWSFHLEDYDKLMTLCKPLTSEVSLAGLPKEVVRLFVSQKKGGCEDSQTEIDWDRIDKKLVECLMPFQREGVIFSIKQNGRVLLADDMGLGKTIQAIAVASYYRTKWPLLVVVPSSLRMTWRRAFIRWLPSVKADRVNVVFTGKDEPNAGLINVISYDLMVKKIKEIREVEYNVIIVDECHSIKNYKAERTKAILPILKASAHVILVSGTPALSRPSELYTQISAVNPKLFPSYHQYGVRYCAAVKNNFGWDYSGSSNMEELQLILEECVMIRRLKKLVLDQLPSKTREVVYLDPSVIKSKSLAGREEKLATAKAKERRSALLEYFVETCSVKATAVREYITDLLDGGHKVIIFAHHRAMLDVICEVLAKKKIEFIRIDGKTLSARRQHLCDQFQRDSGTRAAVLSLTAANTGLTLTEATCVVFAELFWNPGALVQAEDRAYRIGQKNSVVIHYLIARKTADDYLWPLIKKKLDVLSDAGLNKEDFSDLDTKTFQDPKQRDLKDFFESMIEEFEDEDSFLEECLKDEESDRESAEGTVLLEGSASEKKNGKAKLWSERTDGGETSQTTSVNTESSEASLANDISEEWFDDLGNDDWDDLSFGTLPNNSIEPSAKRKRL